MQTALRGNRTYLVVIAMLAFAIIGLVLGQLTTEQAIQIILQALATGGVRAAIANQSK